MGNIGSISCKFAILIKSISLSCVYLKILGNILRTLLLIFFQEYSDKFFLDSKFLLIIFAILINYYYQTGYPIEGDKNKNQFQKFKK